MVLLFTIYYLLFAWLFANVFYIPYNYFMAEVKGKKKQEEDEWDKRKIILFLIIVFLLFAALVVLKDMILGNTYAPKITQKVSSFNPQILVKKNVQDRVSALQKEAENIDLVDIATSSPQVQKIIHDLQSLKDYPNNQIKQGCMNICSKL
jgi:hypothetical protein